MSADGTRGAKPTQPPSDIEAPIEHQEVTKAKAPEEEEQKHKAEGSA